MDRDCLDEAMNVQVICMTGRQKWCCISGAVVVVLMADWPEHVCGQFISLPTGESLCARMLQLDAMAVSL